MYAERAFVLCVHFLLAAHGDTRNGTRCIKGFPRSFTIQLQCSVGEWIHVEQEAYGNRDAATCRLKSSQSCSKVHTNNQNGLIVNCNGKQSCREVIATTTPTNCNFKDTAARVKYNCINGSMDLCSTGANRTTVHGSLYLHSPGFPNSVGVNGSCVVRITGQNIQVTLVEERMKKGLLNISGDGKQLWTSVNVDQYNRALTETAAEVVIVYDNHDQNESNVWIRVDASGQMGITSKGQMSDASATSVTPSTQQPSRSPGTSSHSTSDTPTTATTASTPTTIDQSTTTVTAEPTTEETTTSTTTSDTDQSTTTVTAEPTTEETSTSTSTPDTDINTYVAVMVGVLALCCVSLIVYCKVIRPYRTNLRSNSESPSENIPRKVLQTPSQYRIQNNNVTEDNSYSNLVMYDRTNNYERLHLRNESGEDHGYGDTITEGPSYINTVGGEDHKGNASTEGGPSYINSGGVQDSYSDTCRGESSYANSGGGEDSYSDTGRGGSSYANSGGVEDSHSDTGRGGPSYANSGGGEDSYTDTGRGGSSCANSGGGEDS